jgi:hypothetical protein
MGDKFHVFTKQVSSPFVKEMTMDKNRYIQREKQGFGRCFARTGHAASRIDSRAGSLGFAHRLSHLGPGSYCHEARHMRDGSGGSAPHNCCRRVIRPRAAT